MNELELFAAAIELANPAERAALLDRECAGKPELRARLDQLLAAHDRAQGPLDRQVSGPVVDVSPVGVTVDRPPAGVTGAVVAGKYKLLQPIGEGGMGSVWMAEQTDPVKRRVAVKLLRTERGNSRTILSRFEAERQAIALMDHPHIAKLLDAGTTEAGLPFFVMELVKGVPLNEFCDAHKLSIHERLNLFMQVCSAVQHAHQKGVIHRDLKPTNILVESHDGKPVPKVIDFGLAKATTGLHLSEHTLFTAFGTVMGTPQYMAPEQATFNAVDVDTRADIYALGVVLYELLTATTPLSRETIKKAQLDEMLKLIREQEAPTPSSRLSTSDSQPSVAANRQTEPAKLGRFVKGELDWIVLKALAKERDRRYETASGFAKDIERFLAKEPVAAGPPTAAYRIRKFVQRNRRQVIAASLVLTVLVVGVCGTSAGMLEARRQASIARVEAAAKERAVAEAETAKKEAQAKEAEANAVASFFVNKVFGAGRPKGLPGALGHDVSLRDAIKASLPSLGRSFKGQPLVEARLRMALGFTFYDLCDYARSAEQYEHARALYTRHRGPDHPSTFSSMTELAASYRMLNRHDEAIKLYEETLAARKLPPDHRETLACMANLANCYADLNRHDEAIKLYEVTLATLRRVPNGRANMLLSMHNLALSYAALGRHEEAIKLHQEELGAFELEPPIYDNDTPNSERVNTNAFLARLEIPRDQRLWNMTHLAKNYAALNRHTEALPLLDEVLNKADRPGVNPQLIPFAITLRLRCCQKLGDLAGGRALAEMLEKRQPTDADSLVNAACCRAMTASLQAKANDEGAARLAREEADKAMVWLHKAVAAGWTNAAHMRKDTDLDFLRDREDFQKLLADLEAKSPPTPQEKK